MDEEGIDVIDWDNVPGVEGSTRDLSASDWECAFAYADEFSMLDVSDVVAAWADSPEGYGSITMFGFFKLSDGRWACLNAWADTTGWGCQEGGESSVHETIAHAIRFGMTDEIRRVFYFDQPPDFDTAPLLKELDEIDVALAKVEVDEHGPT